MAAIGPPTGMRDMLPGELFVRTALIDTIRRVYESYGYMPIDTPVMERIEFLSGKAGEDAEQLMFKVMKRGAKLSLDRPNELADMGLRYDLTVALCRFYATHHHRLPSVFRRYHIAPVWRADKPQHGRFREFYQCDVDIIGESSNLPECEVIVATLEALRGLGLEGHYVAMSDRRLLPIVFNEAGLDEQKARKMMVTIDKIDKIGGEGVLAECRGYLADEEHAAVTALITALVADSAPPIDARVFGKWGERRKAELEPILDNLAAIKETVAEVAGTEAPIVFTPSLARGMGYYTGPIFEIRDAKHSFSLAGGGRYDNLIGVFLGKDVPACGFSIGFERILTILNEQEAAAAPVRSRAQVLIAPRRSEDAALAMRLARELRQAGMATEVFPFARKIARQFHHAEHLAIPWVVLLHGDAPPSEQIELCHTTLRTRRKGTWPEILEALRASLAEPQPVEVKTSG